MNNNVNAKKNILIVDDHPMNVDSYKTLLESVDKYKKNTYHLKYDCRETYLFLHNAKHNKQIIHFALIDVNLPSYEEMNMRSGVDIAMEVRKLFPDCKIIIISMHKEPLWVNQIIASVNPEGFIAKNDINYKSFPAVYKTIERNQQYYSCSIKEARKVMIQRNINWDQHDSKILQLLSEGIKTIELNNYIPLSLSSIEKRKANLKKQLLFESGSDKQLLDMAKKLGFI
ncbi:response regulator [Flavobacterium sp.]